MHRECGFWFWRVEPAMTKRNRVAANPGGRGGLGRREVVGRRFFPLQPVPRTVFRPPPWSARRSPRWRGRRTCGAGARSWRAASRSGRRDLSPGSPRASPRPRSPRRRRPVSPARGGAGRFAKCPPRSRRWRRRCGRGRWRGPCRGAFIPKCHWLPFLVWGISGSRCFARFLLADGAATSVSSRGSRPRGPVGVDGGKEALAQAVRFEQAAELQERGGVGHALGHQVDPGEAAQRLAVVEGVFDRLVRQPMPLLEEIDAQLALQPGGRAPALAFRMEGFDDGEQLRPRDQRLHAREELLPPRGLLPGGKLGLQKTPPVDHAPSSGNHALRSSAPWIKARRIKPASP